MVELQNAERLLCRGPPEKVRTGMKNYSDIEIFNRLNTIVEMQAEIINETIMRLKQYETMEEWEGDTLSQKVADAENLRKTLGDV